MSDRKPSVSTMSRSDIDLTTGIFEKDLSRSLKYNWERFSERSHRAKKRIYQFFDKKVYADKKGVLFIIGCQRSGTTLMTEIFDRDLRTRVYGEYSKMSALDAVNKIRLNPLPLVKAEIDRANVSLVVLKPLVETQNSLKLLGYFENGRALWMYRHYKDVASSNLAHFGINNGKNNLRAIVQDMPRNWRSENVSVETRKIITEHFSESMNPYDAAALFWLARNRLFFELGLERHPRAAMCRYEDLLADAGRVMKAIYRFAGAEYPSDDILVDIRAGSGKGKTIELSPSVDRLCRELMEKLDALYEARSVVAKKTP